jgi:hypothetical protein
MRTTVPSTNVNSIHGIDRAFRTGNRRKPGGDLVAGSLAGAPFAGGRRGRPPRFFPGRCAASAVSEVVAMDDGS